MSSATAAPASTIVDLLAWRADHQPEQPAFGFMNHRLDVTETDGYASLADMAGRVAGALERLGVAGAAPVILACAPGLDFVRTFFGILWRGGVAVPTPPPGDAQAERRLRWVAQDAGARWIIASRDTVARNAARETREGLRWVAVEDCLAHEVRHAGPGVAPEAVAVLQYSSGTVGAPHGVRISHRNLMENSELIRRAFVHTAKHRGLVWLPPYHDMGLVGGIVQPVYAGFRTTLMAPRTFLRSPANWLRAITLTGATTSGGPNFAYDHCVALGDAELESAGLDLSRWRVAFTGAETIEPRTLAAFARRFRRFGFRRSAFTCCYGLAEATLLVSGASRMRPPTALAVDRRALAAGEVRVAYDDEPEQRTLIGHGTPAQTVRIVARDGSVATSGTLGEIWVTGASIAEPISSGDERFGARLAGDARAYVRTGDLGFVYRGELFVAGRIKAVLVVHGRNHSAEDVEATCRGLHPDLAQLGCAAFGDDESGVAVLQELPRRWEAPSTLATDIRKAVAEVHGIALAAVALVRHGGLPRTPSGKVRRLAAAQDFANGALPVVEAWQDPGRAARREGRPRARLAPCPPLAAAGHEAEQALRGWLQALLAAELRMSASEVDPDTHFGVYGLDSLAATSLALHIGDQLGRTLEATVFWDYPNCSMLARFLAPAA